MAIFDRLRPESNTGEGQTGSNASSAEVQFETSTDVSDVTMVTEMTVSGEDDQDEAIQQAPSPKYRNEFVPGIPLEKRQIRILIGFALLMSICGTSLVLLGVMINGALGGYRSKRQGPAIWWVGFMPFLLGFGGIYAAGKKRRLWVWRWGLLSLLTVFTQTSIMGLVGHFTTSFYDVWPTQGQRNGHSICEQRGSRCFCQDYFHGVYSRVELPEHHYVFENSTVNGSPIKWRESTFGSCREVTFVSHLYYADMTLWAVFCFVAIVSFVKAMLVSVCAKQDVNYFHRLKDQNIDPDELPGSRADYRNSHIPHISGEGTLGDPEQGVRQLQAVGLIETPEGTSSPVC